MADIYIGTQGALPGFSNLEDLLAWEQANPNWFTGQMGATQPQTPTPTPTPTPTLPPNWKSTFPPMPRAPVTFNDPFAQPGGIYGQSPINVIGATPGGQGLLGDLFANRVSGLLGGLRR